MKTESSSIGLSKKQQTSHARLRPKPVQKNQRRNELILEDYRSYLREHSGLDHHHFLPSGRIGRFDCFIVLLPRDLHSDIHHNITKGVDWFIETRGFENLVIEGMYLLHKFVCSSACEEGQGFLLRRLISEVRKNPSDAEAIVKNFVKSEWK